MSDRRYAEIGRRAYYDPGASPQRVNGAKLSRPTFLRQKTSDLVGASARAAAKRARKQARRLALVRGDG